LADCSKDDGLTSLDGTTWKAEKDYIGGEFSEKPGEPILEFPARAEYTLSFTKLSVVLKVYTTEFREDEIRERNAEFQGDYRYDHPEIVLNVDMKFSGRRDGNTLLLYDDNNREYMFTKQ
jgi:hypothetical protein